MDSIKTVNILPMEEWRVIKQIMIVSDFANNKEYSIGYILYERKLSDKYKFKEIPEEDRDFSYYLDYEKQNIYPTDEIDTIIFQSIRNNFPKSSVRNYFFISNVDKERVKILKNRPFEPSEITFTPDLSQVDISKLVVGQSFNGLRKAIKIYNDFTSESVKNLYFQGYYNLNDDKVLNKIDEIYFI